jgi:hypothetical protein
MSNEGGEKKTLTSKPSEVFFFMLLATMNN